MYKIFEADYTHGAVDRYIQQILFDMVVSIDFGDGECVAYKVYRGTTGWTQEQLVLSKSGALKIPTISRYKNKQCIAIGNAAVAPEQDSKLEVSFKVSPNFWKMDKDGLTFGQCIEDFLAMLWKIILEMDDEGGAEYKIRDALNKGKLLVVMGCPASENWTDMEPLGEYRALVSRATGCKNVTVMPEPKAALLGVFCCGNKKFPFRLIPGKGFVIYDLGSSTLDFIFIRFGEYIVTKSLKLGGADIDKIMMRWAQKAGAENIDQYKMRMEKEAYYTQNASGAGQDPSLEPLKGNGAFTVDAAFMDHVLNDTAQVEIQNGRGKSWAQCCEDFFVETRDIVRSYLIVQPNMTQKAVDEELAGMEVILSGGTSNVTQVQEIARKVWGRQEGAPNDIRMIEDSSTPVAYGLAYAEEQECQAAEETKKDENGCRPAFESVYPIADQFYQEVLLRGIASYFAQVVFQYFSKAAVSLNDGKQHRPIVYDARTQKSIRQSPELSEKNLNLLMSGLLNPERKNGSIAACQDEILKSVNALSMKLYDGRLDQPPVLSKITIDQDTQGAFLKGIPNVIMAFTEKITKRVLWPQRVANYFKTKILKQPVEDLYRQPMKPEKCEKIAAYVTDPNRKQAYLSALYQEIFMEFRNKRTLEKIYKDMIDEQIEIALGQILLLVFGS